MRRLWGDVVITDGSDRGGAKGEQDEQERMTDHLSRPFISANARIFHPPSSRTPTHMHRYGRGHGTLVLVLLLFLQVPTYCWWATRHCGSGTLSIFSSSSSINTRVLLSSPGDAVVGGCHPETKHHLVRRRDKEGRLRQTGRQGGRVPGFT